MSDYDPEELERTAEAIREAGDDLEKINEELLKWKASAHEISKYSAKTTADLEREVELAAELDEALSNRLSGEEQIQAKMQMKLKMARTNLKVLKQEYDQAIKNKDISEADLEAKREAVVNAELAVQAAKDLGAASARASQTAKNLATAMFGVSQNTNSVLKDVKDLGAGGYMQSFAAGLSETLSVGNILGAAFSKLKETTVGVVKKVDDYTASLGATFGPGTDMLTQTMEIQESLAESGIYYADTIAAQKTLYDEFSAFTYVTNAAGESTQTLRNEMAGMAAQFEKLGVGLGETSNAMTTMVSVMGMDGPEAMRAMDQQIRQFGLALNLSAQQSMQMFNRVGPRIAQFGNQGMQVFQQLAAVSKATGTDIGTLVDNVRQFDTFEGAAAAASHLNAILGGPYLSTTQMIAANDAERNELMREALISGGMLTADINKQRAAAMALNIEHADMLALMNANTDVMGSQAQAAQEAATAHHNLDDAVRAATTAQDKIGAAAEDASIRALRDEAEKIIDVMERLAQIISDIPFGLLLGMMSLAGLAVGRLAAVFAKKLGGSLIGVSDSAQEHIDKMTFQSRSMAKLEFDAQRTAIAISDLDDAQKEAAKSAIDQAEAEHMAWLETETMGDMADAVAEQNEGFSKAINGSTGKIDAMTAATNIAAGAMAGFAVFETVSGWMSSLDGPLKVMVGLLLAAAGAWAIFWAFATAGIATAAGSMAAFAGVGAVAGAASGLMPGDVTAAAGGTPKSGIGQTGMAITGDKNGRFTDVTEVTANPDPRMQVINNDNVVAGIAAVAAAGSMAQSPATYGGSGGATGPAATSRGTSAGGSTLREVVINIDGRRMGSTIVDLINDRVEIGGIRQA